jgi:hypothetical protein
VTRLRLATEDELVRQLGHGVLAMNESDRLELRRLMREAAKSAMVRSWLAAAARRLTATPREAALARLMGSDAGSRIIAVQAARDVRAPTAGADDDEEQKAAAAKAAEAAAAAAARGEMIECRVYLTKTAREGWRNAQGAWRTCAEMEVLCEEYARARAGGDAEARRRVAAEERARVERAVERAEREHLLPGPFAQVARQQMGDDVWEKAEEMLLREELNDGDQEWMLKLARLLEAYAAEKAYPCTPATNLGRRVDPRDVRTGPKPAHQTALRGSRDGDGRQRFGLAPSEADRRAGRPEYVEWPEDDALGAEASRAARAAEADPEDPRATPMRVLLADAADEERLLACDNGPTPDPYSCDDATWAHPIVSVMLRHREAEEAGGRGGDDGGDGDGGDGDGSQEGTPGSEPRAGGGGGYGAGTPQGEPFTVRIAPDEAAGICNRTNRKWIVDVCNIETTLGRVVDIVVFTDGSVTPDPVRVGVNRYAGWARLYGALPRRLTRELRQRLQPICGGALNRGAKISFAELVAVNHALGEIIEMLDDLGGAPLVVLLCMDSEGCADELERALREETDDWLTSCDAPYLIESCRNRRARIIEAGGTVLIMKVHGHAQPKRDLGALVPVVNVDAAAKAASRTTVVEPELDVRNTLVLLTAEHDYNRMKKEHLVNGVPEADDGEYDRSVLAIGGRFYRDVTRRLQEQEVLELVRRDDERHAQGGTGRALLNRAQLGLLEGQGRKDRWQACYRDFAAGKCVVRARDGRPGGFAWQGLAMSGCAILPGRERCVCGGRADFRHFWTETCSLAPSREIKAGIRARASSAARETMMWDAVPTEEAHAAAADFESALDMVFGEVGRLPRDAAGEERWARALHTLSGHILKPGAEAMRAAVQRLAKLRGRRRNERLGGAGASSTGGSAAAAAAAGHAPAAADAADAEAAAVAEAAAPAGAEDARGEADDEGTDVGEEMTDTGGGVADLDDLAGFAAVDAEAAGLAAADDALHPTTGDDGGEADDDGAGGGDGDDRPELDGEPDEVETKIVRAALVRGLLAAWNEMAGPMNEIEDALHGEVEGRIRRDGKEHDKPHENDAYRNAQPTWARDGGGESVRAGEDGEARAAALDAIREARRVAKAQQCKERKPEDLVQMGPFAQRRLYGPKTIDEQLRDEIEEAMRTGADGGGGVEAWRAEDEARAAREAHGGEGGGEGGAEDCARGGESGEGVIGEGGGGGAEGGGESGGGSGGGGAEGGGGGGAAGGGGSEETASEGAEHGAASEEAAHGADSAGASTAGAESAAAVPATVAAAADGGEGGGGGGGGKRKETGAGAVGDSDAGAAVEKKKKRETASGGAEHGAASEEAAHGADGAGASTAGAESAAAVRAAAADGGEGEGGGGDGGGGGDDDDGRKRGAGAVGDGDTGAEVEKKKKKKARGKRSGKAHDARNATYVAAGQMAAAREKENVGKQQQQRQQQQQTQHMQQQ